MTSTRSLQDWIGRRETVDDIITATPVAALAATLDQAVTRPAPGTVLPPLWHWLYFLPIHRQSALGPDGHAERGGFLPPVAQPRRMWAGSQFSFHAPLKVGDAAQRVSTITDVREKTGRSGPLTFVKVRHQVFTNGAADAALTEFQDIVYRDAPPAGGDAAGAQSAVAANVKATARVASWTRPITPTDVLLFRYSALTFNGHRIHYDRQYVTQVEGYPGLVVHGPLIATLLIELIREHLPQRRVATFEFRAIRPLFDLHPFSVQGAVSSDGKAVQLWTLNHEGLVTMEASASLD